MRLKKYDYSQEGAYFVTVCTWERGNVLGYVGEGPRALPLMQCNNIGQMVYDIWHDIPKFYSGVETDEFIIMPNHIHGIIIINGRPQGAAPTLSLSDIAHRFKSLTTRKYQNMNNEHKLWQRSYHDRIIRNEKELQEIRKYIVENPLKWHLDRNNPENSEFQKMVCNTRIGR